MRFLSLFSGIDAASLAWLPLGWQAVAFAEIEPFPCAVLAHHYPDVPNLGDVRGITGDMLAALGPIDLAVYGFPCTDLSVAGKRKGLKDEDGKPTRSGLFYEATRIVRLAAERCGCRWFVAENVPGLLTSHRGRDFSAVLRELTGLDLPAPAEGWRNAGIAAIEQGEGWSVAWSVLDAQHFGVPQRRRRVFLVGHLGEWTRPVQVLLEPESLSGNPPASGEAGESIAEALEAGFGNGGGIDDNGNDARGGRLIAASLNSAGNNGGFRTEPGEHLTVAYNIIGLGQEGKNHAYPTETSGCLQHKGLAASGNEAGTVIAFKESQSGTRLSDTHATLDANKGSRRVEGVLGGMGVRRLTVTECERLMGVPDRFTKIPWRGKPADQCPDGPRYRCLGNSMAVPVMAWIGRRITETPGS